MPVFALTGDVDPFLHVSLTRGKSIFCESNAMVMMEDPLDLTGRIQGGFLQAVMRRLANGESFFQQQITATRGDGDCLLSPNLPRHGSTRRRLDSILRFRRGLCSGDRWRAGNSPDARPRERHARRHRRFLYRSFQRLGKLVVSGFGSVFSLDVTPTKSVIIDNGHVVRLGQQPPLCTGGFDHPEPGTAWQLGEQRYRGEGIILKFSGKGRVVVCSRNRTGFVSWMGSKLGIRNS